MKPAANSIATSMANVSFPQTGEVMQYKEHLWKVQRCLYTGPFSTVFIVEDVQRPGTRLAMKVENVVNIVRPVLKLDVHVLQTLKNKRGFPSFVAAGRNASFKFCVMQLVGPDLSKLRRCMPGGKFSLATALNVGIQTLSLLEIFHQAGWLCRDVKAPNLAVGRDSDAATIYMLDFGFARRFMTRDNEWRSRRAHGPLLGTMPYASMATHCRREQAPRDDIESWFYMLCEFVMGALPWRTYTHSTMLEYKQHIRKAGQRDFFSALPAVFSDIMRVIDSTGFYDTVDYAHLRYLVQAAARAEGVDLGGPLDWVAQPSLYDRASRMGDDYVEIVEPDCEHVADPDASSPREGLPTF